MSTDRFQQKILVAPDRTSTTGLTTEVVVAERLDVLADGKCSLT